MPIRDDITPELLALYREIHELTHSACLTCPNAAASLPNRCCDPMACENARKWAALKGVTLQPTGHPTLPFMGADGCVVDITLKPLCALHVCPECPLHGDARYLELVQRITQLEEDWEKYLWQLSAT